MSEILNSSRGAVFFWCMMMVVAFIWTILRFVYKKFKLEEEAPVEKKYVQGSGDQINNPSEIKSQNNPSEIKSVPKEGQQEQPQTLGVKFVANFQTYLFEFAPFVSLSILNVVLFHSWAFNLVLVFFTMIPIIIINIMKVVEPQSAFGSVLTKYFWAFWTVAWFFNIFST